MSDSLEKKCMACSECCRPTEMPLSPKDFARLREMGCDVETCTWFDPETGLRTLANVDGHCYFLDGKGPYRCRLYPNHPTGCKFFPLIFDPETGRCKLDKEYCKQWRAFKHLLEDDSKCVALKRFLKDELRLI